MKKQNTFYLFVFLTILCLAHLFNPSKSSLNPTISKPPIQAGLPFFFSFGGEKVIKVTDFPDNDSYKNFEGIYYDAGVRYKQITLFFIPIWNYDVTWCGYTGVDDKYIPLTYDVLSVQALNASKILPSDPDSAIPFWDKFGGKILVVVLIAIYIIYEEMQSKKLPTTNPSTISTPSQTSNQPTTNPPTISTPSQTSNQPTQSNYQGGYSGGHNNPNSAAEINQNKDGGYQDGDLYK